MFVMDKEAVKAKLRTLEPALKAAGFVHVSLWGSTVRGEAKAGSDVDLLYEFDRSNGHRKPGLIRMEGIRSMISETLGGVPVDLSDKDRLEEYVKANAEREAELVF
jgi:predicted nucleotidyltransferase